MDSLDSYTQSRIDKALADDLPLQALIALDLSTGLPGAACVALVNSLVNRTADATGFRPARVVVLSQIRSCSVEAHPLFLQHFFLLPKVRSVSIQPEAASPA